MSERVILVVDRTLNFIKYIVHDSPNMVHGLSKELK